MFFGTKLIKYQVSFGDLLNLWGFYSLTAPHYGKGSKFMFLCTKLFKYIKSVKLKKLFFKLLKSIENFHLIIFI